MENNKYMTRGVYTKHNNVTITELPIGQWNEDYITFLDKCIKTKKYKLKDYRTCQLTKIFTLN